MTLGSKMNGGTVGRYWRTLRSFWGAALAAELEYQINLLIELLATGGNLAGSLFVLSLFFRSGHGLGGWSWEAALVVLGMYTVLDGIASTLLQPNLSTIVGHVQNGSLDYVLLKPIDSQFWLSLRTVSPWGLPGIVLGVVLMVVGAVRTGATPSLQDLLLTGLMLICGSLILYSLWFILAATSIWFVKVWNATEVLRSFLAAGRYPISAYPIGLRLFFTVVVPVAFLTTVPAEALLGRANLSWLTASGVVTILSLMASRWFWKYALRFYTSASS